MLELDAVRQQRVELVQQVVAGHDGHLEASGAARARALHDGLGAGDGVHAARVGDDLEALLHDIRRELGADLDEVARVAHLGVAQLLLLHDGHRHLGEIVHDEHVDGAVARLVDGRALQVAPEALPGGDAEGRAAFDGARHGQRGGFGSVSAKLPRRARGGPEIQAKTSLWRHDCEMMRARDACVDGAQEFRFFARFRRLPTVLFPLPAMPIRLSLLTLVFLAALPARGQGGEWLEMFAVPGVYDANGGGTVTSISPDGTRGLYVAGWFTNVDGTEVHSIARWTGEEWEPMGGVRSTSWLSGFKGIRATLLMSTGDLVVVGPFDRAVQPDGSEIAAGGIARWTGTQWEAMGSFRSVSGTSEPLALAEFGGAIYVGGNFESVAYGGRVLQVEGIAKWSGSAWERVGSSYIVTSLAVSSAGTLIAGSYGAFSNDGEEQDPRMNGLAEWDGARWRPLGEGPIGEDFGIVETLWADDTGVYATGTFSRLSPSGSVIAHWNGADWSPLPLPGATPRVTQLARVDEALLIAGDNFESESPDGGPRPDAHGLYRYADGNWVPVEGAPVSVESFYSDGTSLVLGWQYSVVWREEVAMGALGRLTPNGLLRPVSTRWDGRNGTPAAASLATDPCGRLVSVGAHPQGRSGRGPSLMKRWDGTRWEMPWGKVLPTTQANKRGRIMGMDFVGGCSDAPEAYAVGSFLEVENPDGSVSEVVDVAYWNGRSWEPVGQGVGSAGDRYISTATEVLARPDGVFIAGQLHSVVQSNGDVLSTLGIARWHGEQWHPLGGGVARYAGSGSVEVLKTAPDGRLVVGGMFNRVIGENGSATHAGGLAVWDTQGGWDVLALPYDETNSEYTWVSDVETHRGDLYIAGSFAGVQATDGTRTETAGVARWDGTAWHAVGDGLAHVTAIEWGPDGNLYAAAGQVLVLEGDAWVPAGGLATGHGWDLARDASGVMYAGGQGVLAGSIPSPNLAAFRPAGSVANAAPPQASGATLRAAPNPARGATTLRFEASGETRLVVYDALGREVAVLHDGPLAPGEHAVRFETGALPAGVYVARLVTASGAESRTLTVVR